MKKILLIIQFLYLTNYIFSQIHLQSITDFEINNNVTIDSLENNIWMIGKPSKNYLDSAFSPLYAIITDTLNLYPIDNYSSFQIKIKPPEFVCWGLGLLSFIHKYDTDSLQAGGYIEIKYDNDSVWKNIIFDNNPESIYANESFYSQSDTIYGNVPCFKGQSNDWASPQFTWMWHIGVKSDYHDSIALRFNFKSNHNCIQKEGWLIDNIEFTLFDCAGNISYSKLFNTKVTINPNPINNESEIKIENDKFSFWNLEIMNIQGKIIRIYNNFSLTNFKLQKNDFQSGLYIYKLVKNETEYHGKFIVN